MTKFWAFFCVFTRRRLFLNWNHKHEELWDRGSSLQHQSHHSRHGWKSSAGVIGSCTYALLSHPGLFCLSFFPSACFASLVRHPLQTSSSNLLAGFLSLFFPFVNSPVQGSSTFFWLPFSSFERESWKISRWKDLRTADKVRESPTFGLLFLRAFAYIYFLSHEMTAGI